VPSVGECVERAARLLRAAGIEAAQRESRLLLAHCIGVDQARIIGYPEALVADADVFEALIARRAAREPLSRILGRREFWSLPFRITSDTLDPRPESETLIETALELLGEAAGLRPLTVLDLGTGSGCLLLAMLHELPMAQGVGVDLSPGAVQVARDNASALGLAGRARFVACDWGTTMNATFDLILSNPPYIRSCEIDGLEPEVALSDPRLALDGGADGLNCYRKLAVSLPKLLTPNGFAILEIGVGMVSGVCRLMSKNNLKCVKKSFDITGKLRCLVFQRYR
jgi:release factor glutamine methyltransferase